MTTPSWFEHPAKTLARYGLKPKKSWGQNFLISHKAVSLIASLCHETNLPILEIGGGLGTMTRGLLQSNALVTVLEQDLQMCHVLNQEFASKTNFQLIQSDAARFDYIKFQKEQPHIITGNLPYQITGAILKAVLLAYPQFAYAMFMVQKEVADRICAQAGNTNRGALSVFFDARCSVKIIHKLKPTAFYPPPKVHSAIIKVIPKDKPVYKDGQSILFDQVVKAAFFTRRKTIKNSLQNAGLGTSSKIEQLLSMSQIDHGIRAQDLDTEKFAHLADNAIKMNLTPLIK